jgi:putative ABC transport system permease protein
VKSPELNMSDWKSEIRARLAGLNLEAVRETEIVEEISQHLDDRFAELRAGGVPEEEARRSALEDLSGGKLLAAELRRVERPARPEAVVFGQTKGNMLQDFFGDVRYGARMLRKNPGFTAVAVLTLALGIGANTAIFSVVNAVLLKALPYREPERLVMLWTDNPAMNLGFHELPPAPPDLLDWRSQAQSFAEIAGIRPRTADLSEQGDPERAGGAQVTANFFASLGAQPALGRLFTAQEEELGRDKVAIISHSLWQRHFGGDTNLIGKTITVNRERRTLLGIMPPGFNFPRGAEMPSAYGLAPRTEVWMPFADNAEYWRNADTRDFIAIGRLKSGVALAQAQAEMSILAQREAKERPATHAGWIIHLRPLTLQVTGKTRPALLVLLAAVVFVLLIACVNVANLLLCRSTARRKEMAVRAAIGAGRSRLLRQLLAESAVLSLLGGGLGLLLGAWAVRVILWLSPSDIPRLGETALDGHVLAFTLLLSLATGVVFGLAPAWHASKINLTLALQGEGRSGTAGERHRVHGPLVIAEVALAVILLTGAGLMAQSFLRLQAVDPGFHPQQVAAFGVSLFGDRYDGEPRFRQFFRDARRRLAAAPGVHAAAAISSLPLDGAENLNHLSFEDVPPPAQGEQPVTENRKITPGYFDTMGVSLLQGRDFDDHDGATPQRVCIINQTIARDFFAGADPTGKRLKLGRTTDNAPWLTIVGVVHDVRGYALAVKPKPQVYSPVEQDTQNEMTFVVRAEAASSASLERTVRAEMKSLDPALPLANFRLMERLVANATAGPRFSAFLLGLFAGMALVLTLVGLYGVVAYAASQRTREIGIRLALGATKQNILALIIRRGIAPPLAGLSLGIAGALGLTRFLAGQLYETQSTDPATFVSVVLVLLLVVSLACWLPARRAAKVDPMTALRYE